MAVQALILIELEARRGEWVSVADLARRMSLVESSVELEMSFLAHERKVELRWNAHNKIDAAMVRSSTTSAEGN